MWGKAMTPLFHPQHPAAFAEWPTAGKRQKVLGKVFGVIVSRYVPDTSDCLSSGKFQGLVKNVVFAEESVAQELSLVASFGSS